MEKKLVSMYNLYWKLNQISVHKKDFQLKNIQFIDLSRFQILIKLRDTEKSFNFISMLDGFSFGFVLGMIIWGKLRQCGIYRSWYCEILGIRLFWNTERDIVSKSSKSLGNRQQCNTLLTEFSLTFLFNHVIQNIL